MYFLWDVKTTSDMVLPGELSLSATTVPHAQISYSLSWLLLFVCLAFCTYHCTSPGTRQEKKTSLLNEFSLCGGLHCYSIAVCGVEARVSLRFWHHRNVPGLLLRGSFILAMAQSSEIRAKAKIISTVPENHGDKMNISEFFEFSS